MSPRCTQVWQQFVDQNWDELQRLKAQGKSVKGLQRKAVNQMLSLADEFGLNPLESKGYHRVGEVGSTANDLIKLMRKAGFKNKDIAVRMEPYAKRLLNMMPRGKLKRLIPGLGYALTAYSLVKFANDPAGSLAAELECSRETAQAILDGQVAVRFGALWNPGQEVDTAQLRDGTSLSVGDYIYVWAREPRFGVPGPLLWTKHLRITEIRLSDTPGKVDLALDDGSQAGMRIPMDGDMEPPQDIIESAVSYD